VVRVPRIDVLVAWCRLSFTGTLPTSDFYYTTMLLRLALVALGGARTVWAADGKYPNAKEKFIAI